MFEITGDDIALLNDEDLRTLVARLCEAELRRLGLPTSAVTWGGNQTAADAGLDVRVALPPGTAIGGFIPRAATGFQVKKPDMPRNDILAEMRPAGMIRPVIHDLATEAGAYIIVSAAGSTSDKALANRRTAMANAVDDVADRDHLALDFYDRTRLATWVRDHLGLVPWVRERIGKSITGWRSYGAWAHTPDASDDAYLLDDAVRLQTGKKDDGAGFTALDGLERIRDILCEPGKIVRLVGLSGVGKTRFAQALFDAGVGARSLTPSLAVYADMANGPDPQPTAVATNLTAQRTRAILVIDNCPPDLHRRLSDLCRTAGSTLSVITVEYDIRDDEPEGTDVFALEPSSADLVEKLASKRFPALSSVDARTVAEFSGGNARIALALAATVGRNETLAGLNDDELFRRLFQQRHEHDQSLLLAAQACALVYSFDGEAVLGDQAEMARLGGLVGETAQEIFGAVAELRRRDLVQQRGIWRAVLPHAIANRLAAMALQNIPWATIDAQLVNGGSERLLKSFSRRLGYLHGSKEAVAIVEHWLAPGGYVGDIGNLNALGKEIFENIAPVAPTATLEAIERALRGANREDVYTNSQHLVQLLRSLAYDSKFFDKAVGMLADFVRADISDSRRDEAAHVVESLFHLYLSGTHAVIEQRLRMIEMWLRSDNPATRALGLRAHSAVLEAWHFSSAYSFDFGAWPRDHGYWPQTGKDVSHWYGAALNLVEVLATTDCPVASAIRALLAEKFRGLWTSAGIFDALERVSEAIAASGFWREGWIAVRQAQRWDAKDMTAEIAERLAILEKRLRPANLVERARAIAFGNRMGSLDLDDLHDQDGDEATTDVDEMVRRLGEELAHDEGAFATLLPELVSAEGRLYALGRGLADGADDGSALWDVLVGELAKKPEASQNVQVLRGVLNAIAEKDTPQADALLTAALAHEALARWYPTLQSAVPIDTQGMARLRQSLASGSAPIERYHVLAWGRSTDGIDARDLSDLIVAIADEPGGFDVAVEILSMRFHADRGMKIEHARELLGAGRELLRRLTFGAKDDREDHRVGGIARVSLVGDQGSVLARDILGKLREAVSLHTTQAYHHDDLLKRLVKAQPAAALDGLFGGGEVERECGVRIIEDTTRLHGNPLDAVPDDVLLAWCAGEAAIRYATAAATITLFHRPEEKAPLQWTSVARIVLAKAPDRVHVLSQYLRRFRPRSWSGSRAAIMESNARMLDELDLDGDQVAISFVARERERLEEAIAEERQSETRRDRGRDERFE